MDKSHFLVTVWSVMETTYEIWADDPEGAIELAFVPHTDCRFQLSERSLSPMIQGMQHVERKFQC